MDSLKILLDTHVLLWWLQDPKQLSKEQKHAIERAHKQGPVYVSDISLWEMATLAELGRLRLSFLIRAFLERAVVEPLAERILVSTAPVHGCALLTRDEGIVEARIVRTIS